MKELLDTEKTNRMSLLTDFNMASAHVDSLKSLEQERQQRSERLGKEASYMKEEIERLKRCENIGCMLVFICLFICLERKIIY